MVDVNITTNTVSASAGATRPFAYPTLAAQTETYSAELTFDETRGKLISHTQAANISLTLASSGNLNGASMILTVKGDGSNSCSFSSDFKDINNNSFADFDNTQWNKICMYYDSADGVVWVNIRAVNPISEGGDTTKPTISSVRVDDANHNIFIIVLSEAVTSTSAGWSPRIDETPSNVTGISGSGTNTLRLTVADSASYGDTLTLNYDSVSGDCADLSSNTLDSVTDQAVTNNVSQSDTTAPTLSSQVVENATDTILDLTFDEIVNITTAGWSIATDGAALSISSVSDSGTATPYFTLSRSIVYGEAITISYDASTGNTLDQAGNELAAITDRLVTNNIEAVFTAVKSLATASASSQYAETAARITDFEFGEGGNEDPFSISIWLKGNTQNANRYVLSYSSSGTNAFSLFWIASNHVSYPNHMWFYVNEDSGNYIRIMSNTPVSVSAWKHVVITYSGVGDESGLKIYVDGSELTGAIQNNNGTYTAMNPGGTDFRFAVGRQARGASYYDGLQDDLSIWGKALSSAEVTEIYNSGVPDDLSEHSAYSDLISWYPYEDDVEDFESGNDLTNQGATYSSDVPS